MLDKPVVRFNALTFGVFGLASLVFGVAGLGAAAILCAIFNLLLAIVFFLSNKSRKAKTALLVGGVLFVIGFGLCSGYWFA